MDKVLWHQIVDRAVATAAKWQNRANALLTSDEREQQTQLQRLLQRPVDKVVLTKLLDQSFRSQDPARVADQVDSILRQHGVPDFFSVRDKLLMQMFMGFGRHFPTVSIPKMIDKMRQDSERAIIPGETEALEKFLARRRQQGLRVNINYLGEAVLGEGEARRRLDMYLEALENPAVEYISVKISTIFSQIEPMAFDHSVKILKSRLTQLFRAARENRFVRHDGIRVPKFVNLDMEEYRDVSITFAAFTQTLEQEALHDVSGGLVLQAYLPDALELQRRLIDWAQRRVAKGGAPIKVRIVKGANMEMEQIEAAHENWPLAPYDNKPAVDTNFKRMVLFGMEPAHIKAVRMGVASHNLFDLALAYEVARHNGVAAFFAFEMLEGMANHVRRALAETGQEIVLYAPVAARAQFINAIAYLIRRLDENTAAGNFLRYAPQLTVDSPEWQLLRDQFVDACQAIDGAQSQPHRTQDRRKEEWHDDGGTLHTEAFRNEPNTDWSLSANRDWADSIRRRWKRNAEDEPVKIPLVIGGEEVWPQKWEPVVLDKSQLPQQMGVAQFGLASEAEAIRAVEIAVQDPDHWRDKTLAERHQVLSRVANALRRARGDLIGAAAADTGKVFTEADVEVSEAIDFAEYYPFSARAYDEMAHINAKGRGVGVVVSPWNFPIAIPCGGIVAALAAGNTVIFKPSSEAVLVAWQLCRCFWEAGISKSTLQFLPCSGARTGKVLIPHPAVAFVILTGGTDTGLRILQQRPDVWLAAETGGKNATIVTAMSDRDQAIKHIVTSAFSNSGQKCSATSLLILEEDVYHDAQFKEQLVDAAASFTAGSAWRFRNRMGPLIHAPRGDLKRALTELDHGETWALKPQNLARNPNLWTPGIKWAVTPGSYTHMTEFFGPVLGVLRARNLKHAVALANQTGYGLTAGLQSLDRREHQQWQNSIRAGNLYINRGTTGAITLRQPFGGMGKSALGAGIKAGGPTYVSQFMHFEESKPPLVMNIPRNHRLLQVIQTWERKMDGDGLKSYQKDLRQTIRAIRSYLYQEQHHFSRTQDFFHLRGQDNTLRFLPVGKVGIRVHPSDTLFEILARLAAAMIARCRPVLSIPDGLDDTHLKFLLNAESQTFMADTPVVVQSDAELIAGLPDYDRLRFAGPERVPQSLFAAAARQGFYIARRPVMMEGKIELIHYYREQSISYDYHRYGNLGDRAL